MDICEIWRRGVGGQQGGGFIPGFFDAGAAAVAGFIAAGEEDHPFLWALGWVRVGRRGEDGLPVGGGEGFDVVGGGFCCGGGDGGGGCGGDVGFCFFKPCLEVFGERFLLLLLLGGCEEGEDDEERGGGEAHVGDAEDKGVSENYSGIDGMLAGRTVGSGDR